MTSNTLTTASQWQMLRAGDLSQLTLVHNVPIGPVEAARGATNSVAIAEDGKGNAEEGRKEENTPEIEASNVDIPLATIDVSYVGLNFADMFACLGLYSATPKGTFVPGLEFSGVITAVNRLAGEVYDPTTTASGGGSSSSSSSASPFLGDHTGKGYKVGDKVFGVTRFGGYTSRLHADTRYIRRLPDGYSLEHGAALPAQALTAWYGLVELGGMGIGVPRPLQLKAWRAQQHNAATCASNAVVGGDNGSTPLLAASEYPFISRLDKIKAAKHKVALIHSGGGGTGLWCLHICRYFNVDIVTTVGSAKKKAELLKMFEEGPNATRLAADGLPTRTVLSVIDRSSCDATDQTRRQAIADALKEIGEKRQALLAKGKAPPSSVVSSSPVGFDYVFDSLQGGWFQPSYDALVPQGRHLILGAGSMTPHGSKVNWFSLAYKYLTRPSIDPLSIMSVNRSVMGFNLIWLFDNVEEVGEFLTSLVEMIQFSTAANESDEKSSVPLLPTVGLRYDSFSDLPKALAEFQSGTTMGKVVVSTQ